MPGVLWGLSHCFPAWVKETCLTEFCAPSVTPGTWAVLWHLHSERLWAHLQPALVFRVLRTTNDHKILCENVTQKRIWTSHLSF